MDTLYKIIIIIVSAFVFISCDPCYGDRGVCAETFSFRIVDKVSGVDLVFNQVPIYHKDSVYLLTTLPGYQGAMSFNDNNKFISRLLIPVDTFYLHLNSADTDTLLMNYDFVKSKCCKTAEGYGKVVGIKYNGMTANKQGDTFIFEK